MGDEKKNKEPMTDKKKKIKKKTQQLSTKDLGEPCYLHFECTSGYCGCEESGCDPTEKKCKEKPAAKPKPPRKPKSQRKPKGQRKPKSQKSSKSPKSSKSSSDEEMPDEMVPQVMLEKTKKAGDAKNFDKIIQMMSEENDEGSGNNKEASSD